MKSLLKILVLVLSVYIAQKSIGYFDFVIKRVLLDKGDMATNLFYRSAFYAHVFFGSIALVVGPFQFFQLIRLKFLAIHRSIGFIYITSCLIGGLSGFYLSFYTYGGMIASAGFMVISVLWGASTTMGFLKIKDKDFEQHRHWMMRSFALTFAAVMLRVWIGVFVGAVGLTYDAAYDIVAWLSWVPNLMLVELLIFKMNRRVIATVN